jgi:hypothetical protein
MALDRNRLAARLLDNFQRGKDEGWDAQQVANALADAIDEYVRDALVEGVTVAVVNDANVPIGTGTQNNSVGLR